ncbi:MAG: efflux RND transporter periplasmic adaptor subunit [Aeromonadaceae bacterium]
MSQQKYEGRWLSLLAILGVGILVGGGGLWLWQQTGQEPHAAPGGQPADAATRQILYYRNPMGLPDISATPKKDEMGMDYLPVYADEQGGALPVAQPKGERQILYYRNPMGLPDISATPKKDEMGMDYLPVYADEQGGALPVAQPKGERQILYYRNPMGLPDISATPKKDEMGMDYLPVYADEPTAGGIALTPERIQTLGVSSEPVRQEPLLRRVRAVGQFTVDERRQVSVSAKFGGWVERLPVNTTGQKVHRGETLLDVYSPELIAAQQEYLIARDSQHRLNLEPTLAGGKRLTLSQGALQRLRFWDIPDEDLSRLVATGQVRRTLSLRAPADGVVLSKSLTQGMRFEAGQTLFELADLSRLWLMVEVFENDLALVQPGQQVAIKVNAYPGERFSGQVAFIYPTLNSQSRTVPVRIELDNRDGRLKPAMYGEAQLAVPVANEQAVSVPESALIDSGTRQVVLVSLGEGRFAPREVQAGVHGETAKGERRVVILQGLLPGEQVVTRANFLLDGESNLQAAFATLAAGVMASPSSASLATSSAVATEPSASKGSLSMGVSGAGE